jgi:hypothetical protein
MKIKSRFTKIAVASGLIVATGASVLGMTSFASAQVAQRSNVVAVAQATDTTLPTDSAVGTTAVDPAAPQAATPNSSATPAAPSVTKADRPSPLATASKVLGITETELKTELQAGKSVADVATAKNVDLATVKAALLAEAKAHLAEEVTSGKHTQAEADAKLAEFTTNLDTMVNRVGPAGGMKGEGRGHGPRGGHGPMGQGAPSAQNTSASV